VREAGIEVLWRETVSISIYQVKPHFKRRQPHFSLARGSQNPVLANPHHLYSTDMPPTSKELRGKSFYCIPLPSHRIKAPNEEAQLKDGLVPAPAVKTLEHQLIEERNRCTRLEQELQRAMAEVEASAQTKRKLDKVRQVMELSETQENDVEHKVRTLRLEKDVSETHKRVGRVGRRADSNS